MDLKYSRHFEDRETARAAGKRIDISFKDAVVICDKVRGMLLNDAIELLDEVSLLKRSIPFRRFNIGIGHRKKAEDFKIGKYPQKASRQIRYVLVNARNNAEEKGMETDDLKIIHVQALKGMKRKEIKAKASGRRWYKQFVHIQVIVG